jgi:monoamine oxidase
MSTHDTAPRAARPRGLTRRKLLRQVAAGAAGVAGILLAPRGRSAAAGPWRRSDVDPGDVDVVVVGAGFAGLTVARKLVEAGRHVVVLEARDRIGGRTCTERVGGLELDVGGQWIGPAQKRVSRLARDLGATTFPTFDEGLNLLEDNGRVKPYHGTVPSLPGLLGYFSVANLGVAMWKLDRLARTVDVERPWETRHAHDLDSQTLAFWQSRALPLHPARRLFDAGMRMVFAAETSQLSLLHALFYVRAAGDVRQLLAVKGGAQASRFRHGTADLVGRLARPLDGRIRLSTAVSAIRHEGERVSVVTAAGQTVRARRVVVAVPPGLALRIAFDPPLAADRTALLSGMPMGSVVKCMAVYEEPFWRAEGRSGQCVSTNGPITATYDNSLPGTPQGVLLGFAVGASAHRLQAMDPDGRRHAALEALAHLFGPRAARPVAYTDHAWAREEWSGGCYSALFPPALWTSVGPALRRPHGRVHWAGTETATEWNGYMEGAIQSGERAAAEVLAA